MAIVGHTHARCYDRGGVGLNPDKPDMRCFLRYMRGAVNTLKNGVGAGRSSMASGWSGDGQRG